MREGLIDIESIIIAILLFLAVIVGYIVAKEKILFGPEELLQCHQLNPNFTVYECRQQVRSDLIKKNEWENLTAVLK